MPSALSDRGLAIGVARVAKRRHSSTPHQNTEWDCNHDPQAAASVCGTAVTAGQAGYVDEAFAYTGRWLDRATGSQNNLNRWYDSNTGRWLSEDPISFAAGDANLYRYVGNEPTGYIDPNGLHFGHWVGPGRPGGSATDPSVGPPGGPRPIYPPGSPNPNPNPTPPPHPVKPPPPPFPNGFNPNHGMHSCWSPGDVFAAWAAGVPGALGRLIGIGGSGGSDSGIDLGGSTPSDAPTQSLLDDGYPPDHIFHGDQPCGPIGPGDGSFLIPKPGWMKK